MIIKEQDERENLYLLLNEIIVERGALRSNQPITLRPTIVAGRTS